jgi:hypothetical protein
MESLCGNLTFIVMQGLLCTVLHLPVGHLDCNLFNYVV